MILRILLIALVVEIGLLIALIAYAIGLNLSNIVELAFKAFHL